MPNSSSIDCVCGLSFNTELEVHVHRIFNPTHTQTYKATFNAPQAPKP